MKSMKNMTIENLFGGGTHIIKTYPNGEWIEMTAEEIAEMNEMNTKSGTAPTTAYDRILLEKEQLDERIVKLNNFLGNPDCLDKVGKKQYDLMTHQLSVMEDYSDILNKRILYWKD